MKRKWKHNLGEGAGQRMKDCRNFFLSIGDKEMGDEYYGNIDAKSASSIFSHSSTLRINLLSPFTLSGKTFWSKSGRT